MRGARVSESKPPRRPIWKLPSANCIELVKVLRGPGNRAQATVAAHLGRHTLTQRRHGDVRPPLGQNIARSLFGCTSMNPGETARPDASGTLPTCLSVSEPGGGDDGDDPARDRDIGQRTSPGVSR